MSALLLLALLGAASAQLPSIKIKQEMGIIRVNTGDPARLTWRYEIDNAAELGQVDVIKGGATTKAFLHRYYGAYYQRTNGLLPTINYTKPSISVLNHDAAAGTFTLDISKALSGEADEYTLKMYYSNLIHEYSSRIILYVYRPPTTPVITAPKFVTNNSEVTFTCTSESRSLPEEYRQPLRYEWISAYFTTRFQTKQGESLVFGNTNYIVLKIDTDVIHIQCLSNDGQLNSTNSAIVRVQVLEDPVLVQQPLPAYSGRDLNIFCQPHVVGEMEFAKISGHIACGDLPSGAQRKVSVAEWVASPRFHIAVSATRDMNHRVCNCRVAYLDEDGATVAETTKQFELVVYYPPEILRIQPVPAFPWREGDVNRELSCFVSAGFPPDVRVHWQCDRKCEDVWRNAMIPIGSLNGVPMTFNDKVTLGRLSASDNQRRFICKVENDFTKFMNVEVLMNVTVDVQYKPLINMYSGTATKVEVNPDSVLSVNAGARLALSCNATGNPVPDRIIWKMGSKELNSGSVVTKQPVEPRHTGVYTCEASAGDLVSHQSISLRVQYMRAELTSTPAVASEGDRVTLECRATGYPANFTFLEWQFRSESNKQFSITPGGKLPPLFTFLGMSTQRPRDTQLLTIDTASWEHAGEYKCAVRNGIDDVAVATTILLINYAPQKSSGLSSPPQIGVSLNDELRLKAVVIAHPKEAEYLWYKQVPGKEVELVLNERHSRLVSELDVTILSEEDTGALYSCKVENSQGYSLLEFQLKPQGPPSTPSSFKVETETAISLSLSWSPGFDGGYLQTFHLHYWPYQSADPGDVSTITVVDSGLGNQRYLLRDLLPDTHYSLRLRGNTDYRGGYWTSNVTTTGKTKVMVALTVESKHPLCLVPQGPFTHLNVSVCSHESVTSLPACNVTTFKSTSEKFCVEVPSQGINYEASVHIFDNEIALHRAQILSDPIAAESAITSTAESPPVSLLIGVAAGISAVLLVLALLVTAFLCRKRRHTKHTGSGKASTNGDPTTGVELHEGRWHSFNTSTNNTNSTVQRNPSLTRPPPAATPPHVADLPEPVYARAVAHASQRRKPKPALSERPPPAPPNKPKGEIVYAQVRVTPSTKKPPPEPPVEYARLDHHKMARVSALPEPRKFAPHDKF